MKINFKKQYKSLVIFTIAQLNLNQKAYMFTQLTKNAVYKQGSIAILNIKLNPGSQNG
jgi:hypothetical protein